MYIARTHDVTVMVEPAYLPSESAPEKNRFVWSYTVKIKNEGNHTVQLLMRHWKITDALGRTQEVRGEGVVGEKPVLKPGDLFEYTSGTPLATPSGIMTGTYFMQTEKGDMIDVAIPAFSLDAEHAARMIN